MSVEFGGIVLDKHGRIAVPKGQGDEIETPPWLFRYLNQTFRFNWDAASTGTNCIVGEAGDCLDLALWARRRTVFMNPPYSHPKPFLRMASRAAEDYGVTTVALIKGDPSTKWWNEWVAGRATLKWLPKRIRFHYLGHPTRDTSNFPSVLAIYWGSKWVP